MQGLHAGLIICRYELDNIFNKVDLKKQVPEELLETWKHFQSEFKEVENDIEAFCNSCLDDKELEKFKGEPIVSRLYKAIAIAEELLSISEKMAPAFTALWAGKLLEQLIKRLPEDAYANDFVLELKKRPDAKNLKAYHVMMQASVYIYGDEAINFIAETWRTIVLERQSKPIVSAAAFVGLPSGRGHTSGKRAFGRVVSSIKSSLKAPALPRYGLPFASSVGAAGGAGSVSSSIAEKWCYDKENK
ncbi:MAG: hypothetical protein K0R66_1435 [Gammaproteobacteria bacterium]|jgi:hypothetical protein|nr:hypothetical protein [Gammaproteobacteria bacterium]